jgi:ribose 5-phosphate isomerase A
MSAETEKRLAGLHAATLVENGMKLGLGTGSTVTHFLEALAARIQSEGLSVVGVPTSEATRKACDKLGIPLGDLDELSPLDLAIDGADEVDGALRLIKGGGGALLREKVVARCAKRFVVIVDQAKCVETLGAFPLPVEIIRFAPQTTLSAMSEAAREAGAHGQIRLRRSPNGHLFITDEGHIIADCVFGRIPDPEKLAKNLSSTTGVVEHGLFLGMAHELIIGRGEKVDTRRA